MNNMAVKWLLDTNTCIAIMNNRPAKVRETLQKKELESVGVSVISLYELQFGVYHSSKVKQNQKTLQAFLDYIQVFDWTPDCAEVAGQLREKLQQKGNLIGPYDLLIAAHGLALKSTLVTNNTNEFKRVPKLKITDWVNA
jgi:tRNA(fMet)-specific endonuclease VapC